MPETLLEVAGLQKIFRVGPLLRSKQVHAVRDVSFSLREGETFGLVGESGCGKSTTGRLAIRLIEPTRGSVRFQNTEITRLGSAALRQMRRDMQIIFQDPVASLDPRMTVESILKEPLRIQWMFDARERRERVHAIMAEVGLRPAYAHRYPHEFSGGQRQRIGIARALILSPKLIVADEPVSALDVSIQAQVLNLLQDLQDRHRLSYLFISHDLSVVKHICQRVAVMYLGAVVETGDRVSIYDNPLHPYTQALLSAIPGGRRRGGRVVLGGDVPSATSPPSGCAFHPRCPRRMEICTREAPKLRRVDGQDVACHLYG
jgi:oligopeptide/dipeptide ABC transporter ATP-binding protein